jgi:hypothetical protein
MEARDFPMEWLAGSLDAAIEGVGDRLEAPTAQPMNHELRMAEQVVRSRPAPRSAGDPLEPPPGDWAGLDCRVENMTNLACPTPRWS